MRHIVSAIVLCIGAAAASAAELPPATYYRGDLALPDGASLPLELEFFFDAAGTASGNMASPAQGTRYVLVTSVTVEGDQIAVRTAAPDALISGEVDSDGAWQATYTQGEFSGELLLKPSKGMTEIKRAQSLRALADWSGEAMVIPAEGASLAGTHVRPRSVRAAALLLGGSGPTQRDGYHAGHRPLAVLSGALAQSGVASLRYDKRGVYRSSGQLDLTDLETIASDARAALEVLRELHPGGPIFVVGHSEGGVVAAMLRAADSQLAGVVSLMGPTLPLLELFALQDAAEATAKGANHQQAEALKSFTRRLYAEAGKHQDVSERMAALSAVLEQASEQEKSLFEQYNGGTGTLGAGMLSAPKYDRLLGVSPMDYWHEATTPALLLFGQRDVQVAAHPNAELAAGLPGVTVITMANINHVMQATDDGSPSNYAKIEETVAEAVLDKLSAWVGEQIE